MSCCRIWIYWVGVTTKFKTWLLVNLVLTHHWKLWEYPKYYYCHHNLFPDFWELFFLLMSQVGQLLHLKNYSSCTYCLVRYHIRLINVPLFIKILAHRMAEFHIDLAQVVSTSQLFSRRSQIIFTTGVTDWLCRNDFKFQTNESKVFVNFMKINIRKVMQSVIIHISHRTAHIYRPVCSFINQKKNEKYTIVSFCEDDIMIIV